MKDTDEEEEAGTKRIREKIVLSDPRHPCFFLFIRVLLEIEP